MIEILLICVHIDLSFLVCFDSSSNQSHENELSGKLQPNHSVRDFQLLAYIQNLGEDQIVSSIIFVFLI